MGPPGLDGAAGDTSKHLAEISSMSKAIPLHTEQAGIISFLYPKFMGEGTKGQRGRITRSKFYKDVAGLRFEPRQCASVQSVLSISMNRRNGYSCADGHTRGTEESQRRTRLSPKGRL